MQASAACTCTPTMLTARDTKLLFLQSNRQGLGLLRGRGCPQGGSDALLALSVYSGEGVASQRKSVIL